MNQADTPSQAESPKNACAQNPITLSIAPDQLRAWLEQRRNAAVEARRSARKTMERLSHEIAVIDSKLAELKIR